MGGFDVWHNERRAVRDAVCVYSAVSVIDVLCTIGWNATHFIYNGISIEHHVHRRYNVSMNGD